MASGTIRNAVHLKLLTVVVFMACETLVRQALEFAYVVFPVRNVTRAAGLAGMRAGQFESRSGVIEIVIFPPAGADMTVLTRLAGVEFLIDLGTVYVVVTIDAFFADLPEFPFLLILLMAGKTRRSRMRPGQGESGAVMVGNGVVADLESIDRMAFGAIRRDHPAGGKLVVVVVLMAVRTLKMGQGVEEIMGMAFFAIDRLVLAFQFESGHVVVEIIRHAGDPEGLFIMAIGALIAEFAFVGILMADRTIVCTHAFAVLENIEGFGCQVMACFAAYLAVFAF